jgi:hypothetical protein
LVSDLNFNDEYVVHVHDLSTCSSHSFGHSVNAEEHPREYYQSGGEHVGMLPKELCTGDHSWPIDTAGNIEIVACLCCIVD